MGFLRGLMVFLIFVFSIAAFCLTLFEKKLAIEANRQGVDYDSVKPYYKRLAAIAIVLAIIVMLTSGIYMLDSSEAAVIFRFDEINREVRNPGVNFMIPLVEQKVVINTQRVEKLEFGFYTDEDGRFVDVEEERFMITSDKAVANLDFIIQFRITDPIAFLKNVHDPIGTLDASSYPVCRSVIASYPLNSTMGGGKSLVQTDMLNDVRKIVDEYELGIEITAVQLQDVNPPTIEVQKAYDEVNNAQSMKDQLINEGNSHKSEVIPIAQGEAAAILEKASAASVMIVNEAKSEVAQFNALVPEYERNKSIMKERMFQECMQEVLPQLRLHVVENDKTTKIVDLREAPSMDVMNAIIDSVSKSNEN